MSACPATAAQKRTFNHFGLVPQPDVSKRSKATPYSITASARLSSVIGNVRPSVFAVLRLITSSIFVGCWTGSSPGALENLHDLCADLPIGVREASAMRRRCGAIHLFG
jgi:hypothetical protein